MLIAGIVIFLAILGETVLGSLKVFTAVTVVIAAGLLMLVNLRVALLLFIIFLGSYEEFVLSSSEAFMAKGIEGSILAVRIMGIGLLDFCLLAFLLPALVRVWYNTKLKNEPLFYPWDMAVLPIVVIWFYGIILGLFHLHTASAFAADVRDLGYLIVFYFIVSRIFRTPKDYFLGVTLLVSTVFLKTSVFVYRFFTGGGISHGYEYLRPLLGSDTALVGLLLTMIIGSLFLFDSLPAWAKTGLIALASYATIILIAGLTRSTYLFTSLGILLLFYIFRDKMKVTTVLIALGVLLLGGLVFYFFILSEKNRELISYLLNSAFNWVEAIKVYGDMSMGQRILEIINIWETLSREGMLWFGMGWGAAWREVVIHHPLDKGAFPLVEQMTGIHTKAHLDPVQYLLKLGVIATPLLYFFIFRVFRKGVRNFNTDTDIKIRWALLGCILMVTIFSLNFIYFARLKFLLGFAFAGILTISQYLKNNDEHSTSIAHSDNAQ